MIQWARDWLGGTLDSHSDIFKVAGFIHMLTSKNYKISAVQFKLASQNWFFSKSDTYSSFCQPILWFSTNLRNAPSFLRSNSFKKPLSTTAPSLITTIWSKRFSAENLNIIFVFFLNVSFSLEHLCTEWAWNIAKISEFCRTQLVEFYSREFVNIHQN